MGDATKIEWTDHTFNPWWGCTRVSPGCERCYAETFAKRTGLAWGPQAERRFFSDKHWNEPRKWDAAAAKAGERRRVFCASMADVFEDRPELEPWRERLWSLIAETPNLDWQLLTKRPGNVARMVPWLWSGWPRNVWLGTTVEDQRRADERIPQLLDVPAAVRFLSCEPLLGPVDLTAVRQDEVYTIDALKGDVSEDGRVGRSCSPSIHWVIVGGESGPGARPMHADWARRIVRDCQAAGVAAFVKQLGAAYSDPVMGIAGARLRVDPDEAVLVCLRRLVDLKGGDPAEWPEDLRVREFPL